MSGLRPPDMRRATDASEHLFGASARDDNNRQGKILKQGHDFQHVLGNPPDAQPAFTVKQQSANLCDAGSRQWTGTVNVTDEKSMFFWYFESRHQPEKRPGYLVAQRWPWRDRQPIGIGFSSVKDRDDMAKNLHEGAYELQKFLSILTSKVFPELASKPWHIAGESMGGHYVTYYLHHILTQELPDAPLDIKVSSAIIVDGYIDFSRQAVGYYDFFCQDWRGDGSSPLINTEECEDMASYIPELGKYFLANVKPGGWNPYDSRRPCIEPPLCSDLDDGPALEYLNKPWVQELLGFHNVSFELIDCDLDRRWDDDRSAYLPTTKQLTWLLDNTNLHILFINGNNDIIVNTPGQMRLLDEQPWKREAWFRAQSFGEWYFK
ncbi:hypothetical protein CEP52_016863 [Fusarium oligoseptatum]|uniref:Uncharacterized protein n=1 Tax=Fusarium oligoseptatum TaxID=2604345 RepID=A0A428RZB8_9HYPO|nr:hypothetical protein CEP52_016863 [Fusarium oligoseptatum]